MSIFRLALCASAAMAAEPSATIQSRLEKNGVDLAGADIEAVKTFPGILFVSRNVPDAGPFFIGALIDRKWVGKIGDDFSAVSPWPAVSTATMRARGWARMSQGNREVFAL